MKNKIYITFLFLFSIYITNSQEVSTFKPAKVTSGKLVNGMHYYIMHNEDPKDRACFYFAQNVGAIQEESSQRGLAHFLEHMAFNGTAHFKDKKMLEYLEKNGLKFGNDINAFTVYDETVYNIKNVPVHNERFLDSVLLILHDWSGSLTLDNKEIDNERGVVREEWRTRYNPKIRTTDTIKNQGLLVGSKYARRSPIGTMDVIDNFKYKELRDYYEKWYRPDLQAVIVVGDIDVKKMEQKIKTIFSNIPLRKNLPERISYNVPLGNDVIYLNVTDKELGAPEIEYYIKHAVDHNLSEKEVLENSIKQRMLSTIFSQRLQEIVQWPSSPVLSIHFGFENIVRPLDVLKITMQPKRDSLLPALQFALTEFRRLMLYGATPSEFNRVKSSMERNLNRPNSTGRSSIYNAIKLYEAFFKNHQLQDYAWEQRFELAYLKTLTNNDLLDYLHAYSTTKDHVIAIKGTDAVQYPTEAEVLEVLETARQVRPEPYKAITLDEKLMDLDLPGAQVVHEEKLKGGKTVRYTLSNGARISLFAGIRKNNDVYFNAFSPGGKSLLDETLLPNALYATVFTSASGLGNLNKIALNASGEVVPVEVKIGDFEESLSGYSNLNNIEKLFKGIYLTFTAPRFDDQAFNITKQNLENLHDVIKGSVQSDLADSLQLARSNYSRRETLFNKQLIDSLSMQSIKTIYTNRIKNASDFDFVFMGDIKTEQFLELAKKYIGSIPGNHTKEKAIDHNMKPRPGIHKVHLSRKMQTPQGTVNISFTGKLKYSNKNKLLITIVEQLLTKRYLEKIREEEGGTYGVRVKGSLQYMPQPSFFLTISFNCNPEKTDRLVAIVYQELKKLSKEIDTAELHEIKSSLKKEIEEKKGYNKKFFDEVIDGLKNNIPLLTDEEKTAEIEAIIEDDIKKLVLKINKNSRVVEGILYPLNNK
ncbi:pitrilysin family protein [Flavivirga sp. 57AJ16]|uniref:M16 family metallopeptidase n=1 Tax=Flavivirga sp. 57AJ16 TaxID=3025307 RepID=UPI002366F23B|nr:M16 family metallopeptidase [Flavivirga sp. 57AJ16]MDD7886920.1 insulinase family protein [Flavivirga sp. 57AJ16]